MRGKYIKESIRDLSGGLNLRDAPSDINNNQATKSVNWDFEGNRLVNITPEERRGNKADSNIQAIKQWGNSIYTIRDGILYRDGVVLSILNGRKWSFDFTIAENERTQLAFHSIYIQQTGYNGEVLYARSASNIMLGDEVRTSPEYGGIYMKQQINGEKIDIFVSDVAGVLHTQVPTLVRLKPQQLSDSGTLTIDGNSFTINPGSISTNLSTIYYALSSTHIIRIGIDTWYRDQGNLSILRKDGQQPAIQYVPDSGNNPVTQEKLFTGLTSNSVFGIGTYTGLLNMEISNWGILITGGQNPVFVTHDGVVSQLSPGISNCRNGTFYNDKIVLGGFSNGAIAFSKTASLTHPEYITDFSGFDAGVQTLGDGLSTPVTGFAKSENGLYVFREDSVWYTNSEKIDSGSSTYNFVFRNITRNGTNKQRNIVPVGQEVFYIDSKYKSLRRLGYEASLTTLRDRSVSKEVEDIFERAQLSTTSDISLLRYSYPNIHVYLPDNFNDKINIGGVTYSAPNIELIYNVDKKSWGEVSRLSGPATLADGDIVVRDDVIYKDRPLEISDWGEWISKEYDLGDHIGNKRFAGVELSGTNTSPAELYMDIYIDGNLMESRKIDKLNINKRIDTFYEGRNIKIGLRYESDFPGVLKPGKIEIYGISFYYYPLRDYKNYI